jgi:hypothetical protein
MAELAAMSLFAKVALGTLAVGTIMNTPEGSQRITPG